MRQQLTQDAGAKTASIRRFNGQTYVDASDRLAVEEPLEIQIGFGSQKRSLRTISITMRTPGSDRELAAGYLFSEGLIQTREDINSILSKPGLVRVELSPRVEVVWPELERHVVTSSSCGVCGTTHIANLSRRFQLPPSQLRVTPEILTDLPSRMRKAQQLFEETGGNHAAALFSATGDLIELFEDVGRHNALDKLIGSQLLQSRLPLPNSILCVSGRASFELVQKALAAGIPMLVAVGAPSSLAIELAEEAEMTLIGFTRPESFNIYSGASRCA